MPTRGLEEAVAPRRFKPHVAPPWVGGNPHKSVDEGRRTHRGTAAIRNGQREADEDDVLLADNVPEIGQKIASKASRAGVAERLPDPAVPKSIAVDLALIDYNDQRLRDLELAMVTTAKPHDANTLYVLQTVPGLGKILRLVLL